MKWAYSIRNKFTAALLLFIALGILFLNNLYVRNSSAKINASIATIYEDRLLVESYIYRYSDQLHKVIEIIDESVGNVSSDGTAISNSVAEIKLLNAAYSKTRLTPEEAVNFNRFSVLCMEMEKHFNAGQLVHVKQVSREALDILHTLSGIQIHEAALERNHAQKLFSSSTLFSNVEIAVLILVAIMIQALIFASKTLRLPAMTGSGRLN